MPAFSSNALLLPLDTQQQKQRLVSIFVAVTFVVLIAAYLKFNTFLAVIGLIMLLATAVTTAFSIQNTLIFLFAYISFLPNYAWGSRYHFFRGIYFSELIAWGIFLVLFVWYLGEEMTGKKSEKIRFSILDWTILFFGITVLFATLKGGFENANFRIIKSEIFFLFCYALYFLYTSRLTLIQIEKCWRILLLITSAVAIEFIMLSFSEIDLASLLVNRISTQQPHLAQLAIPILVGVVLFRNTLIKKLAATMLLLPLFPMVFISQQRALWVSTVFSIFIVAGFAFLKDKLTLSRVFKFIFLVLGILILMIGLILALDRYLAGSVFLTAVSRIQSLMTLSVDESTRIRLSEILRALKNWQMSPINLLFGTGLGDVYQSIDATRVNTHSVDNSFVYILWKLGLTGLAVYLLLACLFVKRGLYVFRYTTIEKHKYLTAALLSGMVGLGLVGLTNACLVSYRFIIIWTLAIATVEKLYIKTKDEQTNIIPIREL